MRLWWSKERGSTLLAMSIPVPLDELARTLHRYPLSYLLTVSDGDRVHAVAASAVVEHDRLRVGPLGRRTLANAAERPAVTLLWPPVEPDGYSLIVDGAAEMSDGGVLVSPTRAVLHRAAATGATAPADTDACVSDCIEVPLSGV
jgi:hypothetical protein